MRFHESLPGLHLCTSPEPFLLCGGSLSKKRTNFCVDHVSEHGVPTSAPCFCDQVRSGHAFRRGCCCWFGAGRPSDSGVMRTKFCARVAAYQLLRWESRALFCTQLAGGLSAMAYQVLRGALSCRQSRQPAPGVPTSALLFHKPRDAGVGGQQNQGGCGWLNLGIRINHEHLFQGLGEHLAEFTAALDL